ncbi:MAG: NAD(P)/FAD-dependent oxidoreductase [Porphyromonas sp.]|nr:NAD(P)/FAD-dependent oxidoreductase [Porphyromonas sp.]
MTYDIAIIGGGPAGSNAAEYAARNGLRVLLFEKKHYGGTCLNEGCIPSKILLHTAHLYRTLQSPKVHALELEGISVNMKALQRRKRNYVKEFGEGIEEFYKEMGVEQCFGQAYIESRLKDGTFVLGVKGKKERYQAQKVMLATGSRNDVPPFEGIETCPYWTSSDVLMLDELPKSISIVGGGTIAVEMASFFVNMGVKTTLIQRSSYLLKDMDKDIRTAVADELVRHGVKLYTGTKLKKFEGHTITFEYQGKQKTVTSEATLIATGRKANEEELGLESLRLKHRNGYILVDKHLETSLKGLYACGDINGLSLLAHSARREAQVAINHILKVEDGMNYKDIPQVVYTHAEASGVGMTEQDTEGRKGYRIHKIPMAYVGRHLIEFGENEGFCKIITFGKKERIVGGHLFGHLSSEYITPIAMAVSLGLTLDQLTRIPFPHPSVAEVVHHAIFPHTVSKK